MQNLYAGNSKALSYKILKLKSGGKQTNKESKKTMKYITSDTHFFHENIIRFCRGEYSGIDDMNESLIEAWNRTVSPNDTVYHLGDFAFGKDMNAIERLIQRLNGKIMLIVGNHDTPAKLKLYQRYFQVACFYQLDDVILTHYPVHSSMLADNSPRSASATERYNIHGHCHGGIIEDSRYLNVNWDVCHRIIILDEAIYSLKNPAMKACPVI